MLPAGGLPQSRPVPAPMQANLATVAGRDPAEDRPDLEPWRARLAIGDQVFVRSASVGGWLQGRVTQTSRDRVKVEYQIGTEMCDKNLLRSSPDLKPAAGAEHNRYAVSAAAPPLAGANGQGPGFGLAPPQAAPEQRRWVDAPAPAAPYSAQAPSWGAPAPMPAPAPFPAGLGAGMPVIRVADLVFGELLGSGGFGSVYRGRLRGQDGLELAIKRLHPTDGSLNPEQLQEFQKEVANLQALRHPRLIRFIGIAWEPPQLCIVTELASGGSLFKLLHVDRVPLAEARRRIMALQIIEGVAFLHGLRPPRVHRDLKSANVVLDGDWNAQLCDFGLTESMDKTHISRREAEGGSPRYMAPEVFDPRNKLTEKLDVWALGCLIIEVAVGRVPHEDCSTIQQVAAKLLVKQLGPFDGGWSIGVDPEVQSLVTPCFQRDAALRPSAQALHDGLSRLESLLLRPALSGPPVSAVEAA